MKTIIISLCLTCIFFSSNTYAQWPGNFYAFVLKDSLGNIITAKNTDYKLSVINDSVSDIVLGIETCIDSTTWRFYEGGNHYMGSIQKLKIERTINGNITATMIIEFPPSLSGGKEQYYRHLYAGDLKFQNGVYQIKLPKTGKQWDKLNELKPCPGKYNNYDFYDISAYQQ